MPISSTNKIKLYFQVTFSLVLPSTLLKYTKARVKRRTSHEPNRMLMRESKGFFSFAFHSAHVKYGV